MSFVAAAATVGGAVGLTGTAAIIGGGALMGAGAGGLYSAITGDGNILNSALTGGLLGATAGGLGAAFGGAAAGAEGAAATTGGLGATAAGGAAPVAAPVAAPLTGANVAGAAALTPEAYMSSAGLAPGAFTMPSSFAPAAEIGYGGLTSDPISGLNAMNGSSWWAEPGTSGLSEVTAGDVIKGKTAKDLAEGEIPSWAKLGAGALGLGYLMQQQNNKYGTTNAAPYNGNSLASFNYDRTKYTPLTTPQPSPAYQAQYENYVKNPFNAYAAKGGRVVSMAGGGIASAAPMVNPSVGPVEQMSRNNATGSNQMFPQAAINSSGFSSATNTPISNNVIASASDVSVDPYTGQQRFAMGGLATTKRYADGGNVTPDQITANSVNYNNALMQQLQSALTAPVPQMNPGQVAQQAPLQVPLSSGPALPQASYQAAPVAQSYQGYSAPSFTRPTSITPIQFQNPGAIVGTKAYNDRIAAEAEAARQAELEAQTQAAANANRSDGPGMSASGGLMPDALRYDIGGFIEDAVTLPLNQVQTAMNNPGQALIGANTPFETQVWNGVTGAKMRPTVDMYGRPIDEFGQLKKYAAGGGVGHLGSYSDGGRMLKGPGDGMSDNIPATIGGKQPARLADGEFVVPADVVSHLGNGSTDAGAKHLYNMMDKVRKARTGNKKQGKQIKPEKFLKG